MKKPSFKKVKEAGSGVRVRYGSYRYAIIAIVLAILVVINLIVSNLPSAMINIDISNTSYYSIGDTTKDIVGNLDQDVDIYILIDEESADTLVDEMLQRYEDLSDHLSVTYVDTATNPSFASTYDADDATENSLIFVSELRSTVVDYNDLYEVEYDYYTYYTTGELTYTQSYSGESEVTSAIDYVTSDTLPVLYVLTGHDEMELSSDVTSQINKLNIETVELDLLTEEEIPEDASGILIYGPSMDLSDSEAELLLEYMEAGGSVLYVPILTTEEMPNLESILANYGLELTETLILEGDSNYYYSYPYYLVPEINSHDITDPLVDGSVNLLIYEPQGIVISDDVRSTVDITSLVVTSDEAYGKDISSGTISSVEVEDGDEVGTYNLAVAVTEEVGDEETQLVVIAAQYLLLEDITDYFSVGNIDLFLNSISWMCEHESTISISSKSLDIETITLTDAQVNLWRTVTMYAIPVALLACGIVVFFVRRKK